MHPDAKLWSRLGSFVGVLSAVLFLLIPSATGHVIIPSGTPTGTANQGGRTVTAGTSSEGVTIIVQYPPSTTDTSIHFAFCFDEGLGTEQPPQYTGGNVPLGSKRAHVGVKTPPGASKVHWVVLFDSNGDWVWGTDGTINV